MPDGKPKTRERLFAPRRDAGAEIGSRSSEPVGRSVYERDPRASGTLEERLVAIDAAIAAPASIRKMRERVLAVVGPDPDMFRSRRRRSLGPRSRWSPSRRPRARSARPSTTRDRSPRPRSRRSPSGGRGPHDHKFLNIDAPESALHPHVAFPPARIVPQRRNRPEPSVIQNRIVLHLSRKNHF